VTEQRVTTQWSSIVSDPDFCNHHWFGCALLSFTAGMYGGCFWRAEELMAREEDGARLWFGEVLQSWFEAVGHVWQQWSWQFKGKEKGFWGAGEWKKKADCARCLERCRSRCGWVVFWEVWIGYRLFPLRQ